MSIERLSGTQAEAFLAAAFALARDAAVTPTWYEPAVRALEAAYGERPLLPAPTLAIDLTALLHGERLLPVAPPTSAVVRDGLRAYEDHVLARLTADRRWTRLTEAVTAAPKELHAAAVGMTVSQVLQRLGLSTGTGVSTGTVRRLATRPIDEVLEAGRVALLQVPVATRLADGFQAMARAARRTRELLSDAEVFLIENIAALKGLGPRVALGQLVEVAQRIEERLPTRLRGHALEEGEVPTRLEEDSAYPVGGFSSIATQGSLENLVTSELVYMESGTGEQLRPDLFDIRFVEGELLYYARDESVAVRRQRTVVLVFDPSLVRARVLDVRESWQRLVWLLGSVIALVRRLSEWLDTEAVRFELVFAAAQGEFPLREEQDIVALALREYHERGQLELATAESSAAAVVAAREGHGHRARVMLFGVGAPVALDEVARPDATIDASGPRPVVRWADGSQSVAELAADATEAWAAGTRALLDGLLRRRRARAA
jgi:hypothetical protein